MKRFSAVSFISCLLAGLLLYILSGCASVYNPATGKYETQFIDTSQEVSIGTNIARQIEQRYCVLDDPALNGRLNFVGQRLAAVSDRKDLVHHFKIIDKDSVNAFTILGGYVYVHKGLLEKVSSDSEFAAVLGHELGHSAARHSAKRLEADLGYQILSSLIFKNEKYADLQRAVDISVDFIMLGYGREDELMADRLGVKYMMRAGYNPEAYIDFLKKLQKMEGDEPGGIGVFFSSHPPISERIMAVRTEIGWLRANGLW